MAVNKTGVGNMAEVFQVHLTFLDINATADGSAEPLLFLQHTSVCGQRRGVMPEDIDRNDVGVDELNKLLPRLYYATANIVREVEKGRALSTCHVPEMGHKNSPAYIRLQNGGRLFLLNSIEGEEYLLAVVIPVSVWWWMGPTTLHVLLSTAVQGYEIPTNVAAVASVPMYCPLRDRIAENAAAVEEVVRIRVKQLIELVALLNECEHRETASSSTLLHVGQEAAVTVRRLCYERPSRIRMNIRVAAVLQQLLWSATSFSDYITLNGALPSGGMSNGYKRLVMTAAAVWHHGIPLFSNGMAEDFEAHLLPVALVAYAKRRLAGHMSDAIQQPITVTCFAMHSSRTPINVCTSGYVKQQQQDGTAAVCVAFVSSGGWIIVLRLEAALNAFTGTPMSYIVSGVTNLITTKLEAPRIASLLQQSTTDSLLEALSASAISAKNKNLVTPAACIMRAVRHLGLFERCCSSATYASAVSRDVCIYRFSPERASDTVSNAARWNPWPEHMRRVVLRPVELATLNFQSRRRPRVCRSVHGEVVFSLLRSQRVVVVVLAMPVYDPVPKVLSFMAEIDPEGFSSAPAVELRAFAMWMLLKAV